MPANKGGEVLYGAGALEERDEHADEELKEHDPGKAFVPQSRNQQLGEACEAQPRYEHPGKAGHGQGKERVTRQKG